MGEAMAAAASPLLLSTSAFWVTSSAAEGSQSVCVARLEACHWQRFTMPLFHPETLKGRTLRCVGNRVVGHETVVTHSVVLEFGAMLKGRHDGPLL
jgi:hypothetical protein